MRKGKKESGKEKGNEDGKAFTIRGKGSRGQGEKEGKGDRKME